MNDVKWIEVPVFIHGITPGEKPGSHKKSYDDLYNNVVEELKNYDGKQFDAKPIYIEWGWGEAEGEGSEGDDKYLAEYQRRIQKRLDVIDEKTKELNRNADIGIPIIKRIKWIGYYTGYIARRINNAINAKVRKLLIFNFSDLFYYISDTGETALRETVFVKIADDVSEIVRKDENIGISLTIFAHSAGSVIGHDFLYHLYKRAVKKEKEEAERIIDSKPKLEADENKARIEDAIDFLVGLKGDDNTDDRIRIRRFYSMGSPILPLAVRKPAYVQDVTQKESEDTYLDPADLGLGERDDIGGVRWINFWEFDDLFSYPIEAVYKTHSANNVKLVEDRFVDLGAYFVPLPDKLDMFVGGRSDVHGKYWKSEEVAKYIAKTW